MQRGAESVKFRAFALGDEFHAAVGQVEARGELGVALVGAVAEPQESSDPLGGVVDVEVHRLVEVRRLFQGVHVLVLGLHPNAHVRILTGGATGCSAPAAASAGEGPET